MARNITTWRKRRFWFQSHVPWHRCGCILVLSLTTKESPPTWKIVPFISANVTNLKQRLQTHHLQPYAYVFCTTAYSSPSSTYITFYPSFPNAITWVEQQTSIIYHLNSPFQSPLDAHSYALSLSQKMCFSAGCDYLCWQLTLDTLLLLHSALWPFLRSSFLAVFLK